MMEVPGFEIKKTIGKGGMGTAYLAVQESLGRQVVLKTMNTTQADQTDFLERFLNEGRIVAALRHPNIITIYDIGATDELVYMAMEYVEGGDLKRRIEQGCTPEETLNVVEQIATALDFAHQEGVIHRDVKPANILFRRDGTPLLGDFGIAKHTKVDTELTSTGTILGSPFYMSPEQAEGQLVDGRSDIYSLGIIFYELLSGERPYPGDSAIKIIVQHIQSPVPTLPEQFKRFQPLISRMLAKNREDRFAAAREVADAVRTLRASLAKEGGEVAVRAEETPGAKAPRKRWAPGEKARAAALLAMVFILCAMFGGFYLYTESLKSSFATRSIAGSVPSIDAGASTGSLETRASAAAGTSSESLGGKEVSKRQFADALTRLATLKFKQGQLTDPPGDNAYYYYSRLLKYDESRALQGFAEIAEQYLSLATKAFSQRDYKRAQTYITLGLQVNANHGGLLKLQSYIENQERSVLDNFIGFFTGNG